jgi:hypothetical protein
VTMKLLLPSTRLTILRLVDPDDSIDVSDESWEPVAVQVPAHVSSTGQTTRGADGVVASTDVRVTVDLSDIRVGDRLLDESTQEVLLVDACRRITSGPVPHVSIRASRTVRLS